MPHCEEFSPHNTNWLQTQSAGAREYTDCISAVGLNSPNEYSGYDTKQSDGKAPVMLEL